MAGGAIGEAAARDPDPIVEAAIQRLEARGAIVKPFRVAEIDLAGNLVRLGDENDARLITAAGKIEPAVLADLRIVPQLLLEIRGPALSNASLDDLRPLANLIGLDVAGTKVTSAGLPAIGRLKSLRMLDLSFDAIQGRSLAELEGLAQLRFLALTNCRLDDTAVPPLGKLGALRFLQMEGTNLSPVGRSAVADHLQGCKISWPKTTQR